MHNNVTLNLTLSRQVTVHLDHGLVLVSLVYPPLTPQRSPGVYGLMVTRSAILPMSARVRRSG